MTLTWSNQIINTTPTQYKKIEKHITSKGYVFYAFKDTYKKGSRVHKLKVTGPELRRVALDSDKLLIKIGKNPINILKKL